MIMIIIKLIDKLLNFIIICFFVVVISFSFYAIYDINLVTEDLTLKGDILKYKPGKTDQKKVVFNLDELRNNINSDICGWIKIENTNIDYPIMFPNNALEYLSKGYDGSYTVGGSIFLDIKNDREFKDDYTVIYGHNVANKTMFADIKKFNDREFFYNNKGGKLYIKDMTYDIEIISYNVIDSANNIAYQVDKYRLGKGKELVNNFARSQINRSNANVSDDDKFILLTTCNGIGSTERAVLFCKIVPSNDSDNEISTVDKDAVRIKNEKEENRVNDNIKNYNPDKGKTHDKIIKSLNNNSVVRGTTVSLTSFIFKYYYIFFIALLIITIGIYVVIYRLSKKRKLEDAKFIKKDDEII